MTTATRPRETLTAARAELLATSIETFGQNLQVPLDVSPKIDHETSQVSGFDVELLQVRFEIPAEIGTNESARAIAKQLDLLSVRLKAVAQAIRMRYEKR